MHSLLCRPARSCALRRRALLLLLLAAPIAAPLAKAETVRHVFGGEISTALEGTTYAGREGSAFELVVLIDTALPGRLQRIPPPVTPLSEATQSFQAEIRRTGGRGSPYVYVQDPIEIALRVAGETVYQTRRASEPGPSLALGLLQPQLTTTTNADFPLRPSPPFTPGLFDHIRLTTRDGFSLGLGRPTPPDPDLQNRAEPVPIDIPRRLVRAEWDDVFFAINLPVTQTGPLTIALAGNVTTITSSIVPEPNTALLIGLGLGGLAGTRSRRA